MIGLDTNVVVRYFARNDERNGMRAISIVAGPLDQAIGKNRF